MSPAQKTEAFRPSLSSAAARRDISFPATSWNSWTRAVRRVPPREPCVEAMTNAPRTVRTSMKAVPLVLVHAKVRPSTISHEVAFGARRCRRPLFAKSARPPETFSAQASTSRRPKGRSASSFTYFRKEPSSCVIRTTKSSFAYESDMTARRPFLPLLPFALSRWFTVSTRAVSGTGASLGQATRQLDTTKSSTVGRCCAWPQKSLSACWPPAVHLVSSTAGQPHRPSVGAAHCQAQPRCSAQGSSVAGRARSLISSHTRSGTLPFTGWLQYLPVRVLTPFPHWAEHSE
mmetsp:Transcript_87684/g.283881  ORF Transcript_87684/g.283881 Transcript_87684/m.283881 type:complete len:289 (+) Transcript_87684:603-1469(+)